MDDGKYPHNFDQRVHHVCANVQRNETPAFELYLQSQIREALRALLTSKGLYQKIDVSLPDLKKRCGIFPTAPAPPAHPPISGPFWGPASPTRSKMTESEALLEAAVRVWDPQVPTKGAIYHNPLSGELIPSKKASSALLQFYPPGFSAYCETETCKAESIFGLQMVYWERSGVYEPIRKTRAGTQQVWHLYYRCEQCHDFSNVITVKRVGLRLVVCGRSERFVPSVHRLVPKELRPIMEDALNAANENDIFGGFYHLRTFIEHYMKVQLGVQPAAKLDGDELCSSYSKSLDPRMREGLPSLGPIFTDLSQKLHGREGERRDFEENLEKIHHHLEAKTLFGKYTK